MHRFVPAPVRQRHRRDHPVCRRERAGQHQLPRHQRRPAARRGSRDPVTPVLPRSAAHTPVLRVAFLPLRRKITLQADARLASPGRPAETARARYPGRTRRTGPRAAPPAPRPKRPAPSAPRRRHPQWSAGAQSASWSRHSGEAERREHRGDYAGRPVTEARDGGRLRPGVQPGRPQQRHAPGSVTSPAGLLRTSRIRASRAACVSGSSS